jgi:outer membrane murein-binding lipoprotein Lpp
VTEPARNNNGRRGTGVYIPWPGMSLIITICLAVGGPTAAFMVSNATLKAEVRILSSNVAELNGNVKELNKAVSAASRERERIATTLAEWKVSVDSRLDKIERKLP